MNLTGKGYFKKGHQGWNKGKKGLQIAWNKGLTKETDERVRKGAEKHIGKPSGMLNKHHTKEVKIRIGEHSSLRNSNIRFNWKGVKKSKEHIRKSLQRRIPSNLEQQAINLIKKHNLPYKFVGDGKFFIENKNPDFVNCNGEKIAIEVFYRKHKEQFVGGLELWKRDRQEIFNRYGWRIIFLDETQINEKDLRRWLK